MTQRQAEHIVNTLFNDMVLRKGFRQLLDEIDEDTLIEIRATWCERIIDVSKDYE